MARRSAPLLVVGLVLAGCASSQSLPEKAAAPADATDRLCVEIAKAGSWRGASTASGGTVAVDADDRGFAPTCIRSPAGGFTVVVTNRGRLPHTFSVPALLISRTVDAGQTVLVDIPPLDGPLRVVCDFHKEEKMFAAIVPDAHA